MYHAMINAWEFSRLENTVIMSFKDYSRGLALRYPKKKLLVDALIEPGYIFYVNPYRKVRQYRLNPTNSVPMYMITDNYHNFNWDYFTKDTK